MILSQGICAKAGMNTFEIPAGYHGVIVPQILQGDKKFIGEEFATECREKFVILDEIFALARLLHFTQN